MSKIYVKLTRFIDVRVAFDHKNFQSEFLRTKIVHFLYSVIRYDIVVLC